MHTDVGVYVHMCRYVKALSVNIETDSVVLSRYSSSENTGLFVMLTLLP